VFEFRCNLYAEEGQLGLMDAQRDTAVMPCGPKVDITYATDLGGHARRSKDATKILRSAVDAS
jgi:hypothetical protein